MLNEGYTNLSKSVILLTIEFIFQRSTRFAPL